MSKGKSQIKFIREVDESRPCYTKWSQKEKNKYYILTYIYMEPRKMVLINLSAWKELGHRYKE